jgi:transposase
VKINSKDVNTIVDQIRKDLQEDVSLPPALRSSIEMLLLVVTLLINKIGLNSRNSSKPPSSDPNRKKNSSTDGEKQKKPGGQKGHKGTSLEPVAEPDEIIVVEIDTTTLPSGKYQPDGFESRQVFDVDISTFVTEYQAQRLLDQNGQRWVAPFPDDVAATTQYGPGVKANTVYMSQYQLIPYKRVEEQFRDQFQIPISAATVFNFNQDAFNRLEHFEQWVKGRLIKSALINADETGINIAGKRHWLHCASNDRYTLFQPHAKRGDEALKDIGILLLFGGTLCHDHWKPYFNFGKKHSLCNAHHLRELERAWEQDNQKWAKELQCLLTEINNAKHLASGSLTIITRRDFRKRYKNILSEAEKECPPPEEKDRKEKRGRLKRSKSRNLLERLREYEDETLLFMDDPIVPFTNNQAENDVRMTKVQQKISGCFRSMEGAAIFCRVRSYLSTCRKNGASATSALRDLFQGKWPEFMSEP